MDAIRKRELSEITEKITALGLNVTDFKREDFALNHLIISCGDSGLEFHFIMSDNDFRKFNYSYTRYTPDRSVVAITDFRDLVDVLAAFGKWIVNNVKPYLREMETPDPWEGFKKMNFPGEESEAFFSEQEIIKIENGLDKVLAFSKDVLLLQGEKLDALAKDLADLKEDSRKMNKGKWFKFFSGVIFQIGIDHLIDLDKRTLLIEKFSVLYNALVENLPKLPFNIIQH